MRELVIKQNKVERYLEKEHIVAYFAQIICIAIAINKPSWLFTLFLLFFKH